MTSQLSATPIKTSIFRPGMDLYAFLVEHLQQKSLEGRVLAITSKIISVWENRLVKKDEISKIDLIHRESEHFICETSYNCTLTVNEGLLIPSAGIDESNSESGDYILFP